MNVGPTLFVHNASQMALLQLICSLISMRLISMIPMAISQPTCDPSVPSPVVIAVRNVTLAGQVIRRGAELSPGTPPQSLAFGLLPYATVDSFDRASQEIETNIP